MPRLNVYIPDWLSMELRAYRGEINFSGVCTHALGAELSARQTDRRAVGLLSRIVMTPSDIEQAVAARFRLDRVIAPPVPKGFELREFVTDKAASFLDALVGEHMQIGVGGGTQMWSIVRRLTPRNLRMDISAIGFGGVDHAAPHVHPNMLATVMSLLYAPRSTPRLVGSPAFAAAWSLDGEPGKDVRRAIIGACARFDAESAYARVLGADITDVLEDAHVVGDFLGVFLAADGRLVEPYVPGSTVSHIGSAELREHARRPDTIVALVATGKEKVNLIRLVLRAELCNTLITDESTAYILLRRTYEVDDVAR